MGLLSDLGQFISGIGGVGQTVATTVEQEQQREWEREQFEKTQAENARLNAENNAHNQLLTEMTNQANAEIQNSINETNMQMQQQANEMNMAISDATNQTNKEIAEATNKANAEAIASQNQTNKEIAEQTNAMNKAVADQNLQFQREQQKYEEELQQKMFEREDTSYQRTVADMEASGLSALAMSGLNGSGSAVSRTQSNNGMQYQGYTANASTAQGYTAVGSQWGATKAEAWKNERAVMNAFQRAQYSGAKSDLASGAFKGLEELGQTMCKGDMMREQVAQMKEQTLQEKEKTNQMAMQTASMKNEQDWLENNNKTLIGGKKGGNSRLAYDTYWAQKRIDDERNDKAEYYNLDQMREKEKLYWDNYWKQKNADFNDSVQSWKEANYDKEMLLGIMKGIGGAVF